MRYITIPAAVTLMATRPGSAVPEEVAFSFADLLKQHVWPHEMWRTGSAENSEAFWRLVEAFRDKQPGEVGAVTDADYELFAPLATLRDQKLQVGMAVEVSRLMKPIISAPSKDPRAGDGEPRTGGPALIRDLDAERAAMMTAARAAAAAAGAHGDGGAS